VILIYISVGKRWDRGSILGYVMVASIGQLCLSMSHSMISFCIIATPENMGPTNFYFCTLPQY
jgi:hypothetical protein